MATISRFWIPHSPRFWALVGIVCALALPQFLTNYWAGVFNETLITIIGALALNLLMGTTGQISLGHAGFVAAGAFTVAILLSISTMPIVALLCSGGACWRLCSVFWSGCPL